jgi:hypothetical protein
MTASAANDDQTTRHPRLTKTQADDTGPQPRPGAKSGSDLFIMRETLRPPPPPPAPALTMAPLWSKQSGGVWPLGGVHQWQLWPRQSIVARHVSLL